MTEEAEPDVFFPLEMTSNTKVIIEVGVSTRSTLQGAPASPEKRIRASQIYEMTKQAVAVLQCGDERRSLEHSAGRSGHAESL